MIYIRQNSDCGVIHTRKNLPTGTPENTGRTYTVSRCGPFWEVRCQTRERGRVAGDQLVATWPTEQEADAHASELANPEYARNRGRRILEELIEEDRDAG